jgi:5-methyltetrahydropteroyltriglutamate--homocysteine methyltransferase
LLLARTDVVGSLLRPRELLAARERGDPTELRAVEDACVEDVLRRQAEAGLAVVTDGELRRLSFQSQMVEAVEGFGEWNLDAFLWGDWRSDAVGDLHLERPPLAAVGRLRRRRFLSVDEFRFARRRTDRVLKVTLPSPSLFSQFWDPERSRAHYDTLEAFLWGVAGILREEVVELARLGATYLQLDAPHYPLLADPRWRAFYEERGSLELWLELDNAVLDAAPGVTWGFHLCRGNQGSRWLVEGGYEPLAEALLPRIRAERLLLEYDDERSGGFEPLRAVPDDRVVVLGLVTTKTPRRETSDELALRIEEAARVVPLERLALSPQCGFATSIVGNALTEDDQWAKLRTVAKTAALVWG